MSDGALEAMRGYAFTALLVAITWGLLAQCGDVGDVRADDVTQQLAVARACAGEASLGVTEDECAAIGEILLRRGWRYSAALRTCRQPWVCGLDASGAEPAGWPAHWSWRAWRDEWLDLYAYAGRVVRGEARSPCAGRADHFGGHMDAPRAWRAGWRPVQCGRTVNWFWSSRRR